MNVELEYSNVRCGLESAIGLIQTVQTALAVTDNHYGEVSTLDIAIQILTGVDEELAGQSVTTVTTTDLGAVETP